MARLKAFQDKYAALFNLSSGSQLVSSSGASLTAAAVSRSPISAYFRCNSLANLLAWGEEGSLVPSIKDIATMLLACPGGCLSCQQARDAWVDQADDSWAPAGERRGWETAGHTQALSSLRLTCDSPLYREQVRCCHFFE